jgi:hypothetical protein
VCCNVLDYFKEMNIYIISAKYERVNEWVNEWMNQLRCVVRLNRETKKKLFKKKKITKIEREKRMLPERLTNTQFSISIFSLLVIFVLVVTWIFSMTDREIFRVSGLSFAVHFNRVNEVYWKVVLIIIYILRAKKYYFVHT